MGPTRRRWIGWVAWLGAVASWWFVPWVVCGHHAKAYYRGEVDTQECLARTVANDVNAAARLQIYRSGNARFDGQSAIAFYQMAALGLGQFVLEHPEKKSEYLPTIERAVERLVDPRTHPYAAQVYGRHGTTSLGAGGHAYMGYVNLGLGILRRIDPETKYAELHDRLTGDLARQIGRAPNGLIETYPGETWPPDVAAVAGSIGLHGAATGHDWEPLLGPWAQRFANCALGEGGYLIQRMRTGSCSRLDAPRGSGTAIAAYFLSFADPGLSLCLWESLRDTGYRSLLGFGGIREYVPGQWGMGDGNSGPVVVGLSAGASGFGLGAARAHGDRASYVGIYRTGALVSVPVITAGQTRFVLGGALGNALLLAMLTALPPNASDPK